MTAVPTRLAPVPFEVLETVPETTDSRTLLLRAPAGQEIVPAPGQFNMLYPFGIGEAAISLSALGDEPGLLLHTVRGVGATSRAIAALKPGDWLGVRGPFGVGWPMGQARGQDIILIAGGIGMAPLRPVVHAVLRERSAFGRLLVFYGARTPRERLFAAELTRWETSRELEFALTVDAGNANWSGRVGFVTALLGQANIDPERTIIMTCGPEVMMRATAQQAMARGVAARNIYVSMERNMKCAAGLCGHCQFGPVFICKDGPVFSYERVADLLIVREI